MEPRCNGVTKSSAGQLFPGEGEVDDWPMPAIDVTVQQMDYEWEGAKIPPTATMP
jgi:hypothetical protein